MNVKLNEDQVREIFRATFNQDDILVSLYRLVFPEWDRIEYVMEGRPRIGRQGWRTIFELFERFDEEHLRNEGIVPGYFWISLGFSKDENLGDWEVDASDVKVRYKDDRSD